MDRRHKLWASAALAAAVGCQTQRTQYRPADNPAAMPAAAPRGLGVAKFFNTDKPPTPGMSGEQLTVRPPRKPGEGLKADTEVDLATVDLDLALMKESATERDQLFDAARQKYARALRKEPQNRNAAIGLARLYTATGDKANAVATLTAATRHYPADHELAHRLAATEYQFGDYAAGAEACQAALKVDPNNRKYLKTLALCQAHQDNWDGAFATLVQSNVMSQAEGRYFLGRVLLDIGRIDDGRSQIAEAAKLDPNYVLASQTLTDLDAGRRLPPAGGGVVTAGAEEAAK